MRNYNDNDNYSFVYIIYKLISKHIVDGFLHHWFGSGASIRYLDERLKSN